MFCQNRRNLIISSMLLCAQCRTVFIRLWISLIYVKLTQYRLWGKGNVITRENKTYILLLLQSIQTVFQWMTEDFTGLCTGVLTGKQYSRFEGSYWSLIFSCWLKVRWSSLTCRILQKLTNHFHVPLLRISFLTIKKLSTWI